MELEAIAAGLDEYFGVMRLDTDPSFASWMPEVYGERWGEVQRLFEGEFCRRFNGLLLRGERGVGRVFAAAFPSPEVLSRFLVESERGDLLFLHHPIDMQCGDPRGELGRGFYAIEQETLNALREKGLSLYACHAPLDTHQETSTTLAMVEALSGTVVGEFLPYGLGWAGLIAEIPPHSTEELTDKLLQIYSLPYLDFGGCQHREIRRIGVVAGGGDRVECMKECEAAGCQGYLTGEIHHHIAGEPFTSRREELRRYFQTTTLSCFGVSHAASEFLVMTHAIPTLFRTLFSLPVTPIPESRWWR